VRIRPTSLLEKWGAGRTARDLHPRPAVAGAEESRFAGSHPGGRLESRSEEIRPGSRSGSLGRKRWTRARLAEELEQPGDLGRRDIAAADVSNCEEFECSRKVLL
jgi:hypothetical protein